MYVRMYYDFCLFVPSFSCQFVVKGTGDYSVHLHDPDTLVEWDCIEQVVSSRTYVRTSLLHVYTGEFRSVECYSLNYDYYNKRFHCPFGTYRKDYYCKCICVHTCNVILICYVHTYICISMYCSHIHIIFGCT